MRVTWYKGKVIRCFESGGSGGSGGSGMPVMANPHTIPIIGYLILGDGAKHFNGVNFL